MYRDINLLKAVLAEKKRTIKWSTEKPGGDPATVSKLATNVCQPPMETHLKTANVLEVELDELLNKRYIIAMTKKTNE